MDDSIILHRLPASLLPLGPIGCHASQPVSPEAVPCDCSFPSSVCSFPSNPSLLWRAAQSASRGEGEEGKSACTTCPHSANLSIQIKLHSLNTFRRFNAIYIYSHFITCHCMLLHCSIHHFNLEVLHFSGELDCLRLDLFYRSLNLEGENENGKERKMGHW